MFSKNETKFCRNQLTQKLFEYRSDIKQKEFFNACPSASAAVKIDPNVDKTSLTTTTTTLESPTFADHSTVDVATTSNNAEVGGFDLVVQVNLYRC